MGTVVYQIIDGWFAKYVDKFKKGIREGKRERERDRATRETFSEEPRGNLGRKVNGNMETLIYRPQFSNPNSSQEQQGKVAHFGDVLP